VDAGSGTSLDNINIKTISAWIKLDSYGSTGFGVMVCKDDSLDTIAGWTFYVEGGGNSRLGYIHRFTPIAEWVTPVNSLSLGKWYHVVVVYDRTSTANDPIFYINGSKQSVTENTAPSGSAVNDSSMLLHLSVLGEDTRRDYFGGTIDDVRIYNQALSADEIKRLYNMGR
jgi:hypothetical protein